MNTRKGLSIKRVRELQMKIRNEAAMMDKAGWAVEMLYMRKRMGFMKKPNREW